MKTFKQFVDEVYSQGEKNYHRDALKKKEKPEIKHFIKRYPKEIEMNPNRGYDMPIAPPTKRYPPVGRQVTEV